VQPKATSSLSSVLMNEEINIALQTTLYAWTKHRGRFNSFVATQSFQSTNAAEHSSKQCDWIAMPHDGSLGIGRPAEATPAFTFPPRCGASKRTPLTTPLSH